MERCYYKVENTDCDLFKKTSEFLDMENELISSQKKAVEEKLPKFSHYQGSKGFNRVFLYD